MNYGSAKLYKYNRKNAKVGNIITLSPTNGARRFATGNTDTAKLSKRQSDGSWWALFEDGSEWAVGGGYDWKIA